jgi:RNA polymerase sigma-70 factor, ECF subfamily
VSPPGQVTILLGQLRAGNKHAAGELFSLFYKELHRLAASRIRNSPSHTLQPTALVNELFLEFLRQGAMEIEDKNHFFAVSAYLLKQLLHVKEPLPEEFAPAQENPEILLILDDVLRRLGELDPQQLRVVELRMLEGRSVAETGAELKISERHVTRECGIAQSWLQRELRRGCSSHNS